MSSTFVVISFSSYVTGLELFTHTGSSGGFHSLVAVLPDLDHGLFIGINKSPDYFARDVISMYLLDTLSGKLI